MLKVEQLYNDLKDNGMDPIKVFVSDLKGLYQLEEESQQRLKLMLIADAFRFHYENNEFYRKQCMEKGVSPEQINNFEDINRIPLIPVSLFKSPDSHKLLTKSLIHIEHEMRSTGTSGIPSISRRCGDTLDNAVIAIYAMYREFFKLSKGAGLCLCPSTEEIPEMGMIKAFTFLSGLLDCHAFMVSNDRFIPEQAVEQLAKWQNKFTRHIIGPPFLIHRFISFLKATNTKLTLEPDSLVITLGGWKRFTGQMISRKAFNEECAEYLGIAPENVRDMYGLVEANMLVIEDEFQIKHVPPYVHFSVRDPNDLTKEVAPGKTGQLVIFDPLARSTPGMILTEDMVHLVPEVSPSGRTGQRIQYVMRAPNAKEFGCCAVNLEQKMNADEEVACPLVEA